MYLWGGARRGGGAVSQNLSWGWQRLSGLHWALQYKVKGVCALWARAEE